jgi:hypothetical protein
MKFTREQVIEMANHCGLVGYGEDAGEYRIPAAAFHARMERFATLAADAALEAAAVECDQQETFEGAVLANHIRAMKEKA